MSRLTRDHWLVPVLAMLMMAVAAQACGQGSQQAPGGEVATEAPAPATIVAEVSPAPNGSQPTFAGTLLLQRWTENENSGSKSLGIYELQAGWSEPRQATDPGFDASAITGRILAASPNWRKLVFAPHFLLDTGSKEIVPLPVPDIAEVAPEYQVYGATFSPDGQRLSYRLGYPSPRTLFVLDFASNKALRIHQGNCAEYQLGRRCEEVGDPSWIDSDTVLFTYHEGLPFSYKPGSQDDPNSPNRLAVTTERGAIILSVASEFYEYQAIDGTVFRLRNHPLGPFFSNAWLDGADLKKGIIDNWHKFSVPIEDDLGPAISTVSPGARSILAVEVPHWRLVDVHTGQETVLGTEYRPYLYGHPPNPFQQDCLWSPDSTKVACLVQEESGQERLLMIPLSKEPAEFVSFAKEPHGHWELLDWRP